MTTADIYDIEGKWLRVVSLDFLGPCVHSQDGRFVLAWQNARLDSRGETVRPGRFLLVEGPAGRPTGDENHVCVRGAMRRTLTGCVANDGRFLIACGPRRLGDLQSTVYGVRADGSVIIKHRIDAFVGPSAISADGSTAVCQATDGEPGDDRGMLHLFDLETGTLGWRLKPEAGWPARLHVDADRRVVEAFYGLGDGEGVRRYTFEGTPADGLDGDPGAVPARLITELKPGTENRCDH